MTQPARDAPTGSGVDSRKTAALLLDRVVNGLDSLDQLCDAQSGHVAWRTLEPRDQALARAIVITALRRRRQIECILDKVLDRALPRRAKRLHAVLHVAAAQILFLNTPDRAAVDIAVGLLGNDPQTARFSGLGNAILRRIGREKEILLAECNDWRHALSPWLARRVRKDHGMRKAELIHRASLMEPKLDLSLHPRLDDARRRQLAQELGGEFLETGSFRLHNSSRIDELEGYASGEWWVQDAASALPARLLGSVHGKRIADLCAAPGGKTAQLAAAGARVTAIDHSARRMERLHENLARLRLEAECVTADLLEWQPDRPFDAVLLDAPCSSTGTLRRHPDVAWTKNDEIVDSLAKLQLELIRRAAEMLRPGGMLVYSNCSILKQEGEDLLPAILAHCQNLAVEPVRPGQVAGMGDWINGQGALRTLPDGSLTNGGLDGFFAVRFRHTDAS